MNLLTMHSAFVLLRRGYFLVLARIESKVGQRQWRRMWSRIYWASRFGTKGESICWEKMGLGKHVCGMGAGKRRPYSPKSS